MRKNKQVLLHIQPLLTQQSEKIFIDVGESHQSLKLLAVHWATTGSTKKLAKKNNSFTSRGREINNKNRILNKWNKYSSLHLFFTEKNELEIVPSIDFYNRQNEKNLDGRKVQRNYQEFTNFKGNRFFLFLNTEK